MSFDYRLERLLKAKCRLQQKKPNKVQIECLSMEPTKISFRLEFGLSDIIISTFSWSKIMFVSVMIHFHEVYSHLDILSPKKAQLIAY